MEVGSGTSLGGRVEMGEGAEITDCCEGEVVEIYWRVCDVQRLSLRANPVVDEWSERKEENKHLP